MRTGIHFDAADRARLEAIAADPNSCQKHAWRARIVLATADGLGTRAITHRAGKSKPCVWRWQECFMREGVPGLLRDKTRKPGKAPLPAATVERVVGLTLEGPSGEATHWTGRAMAKQAGVALRSVQRIWAAHRFAPHRVRTLTPWRTRKRASRRSTVSGVKPSDIRTGILPQALFEERLDVVGAPITTTAREWRGR